MNDIVIVGTSLAGLRTGEALRREGHTGKLTLVGAETHFPPYDRPPLSKQVLAGTWEAERARLAIGGLEAEMLLGEHATRLNVRDRHVEIGESGTRVKFDGLVVATGVMPRRLAIAPPDMEGILCLRTLEDCRALRRLFDGSPAVAVIGAGFIGCEVAATARSLGLHVTMLDVAESPLTRSCGEPVSGFVEQLHRDHGVVLRLGRQVVGFAGGKRVEELLLDDGSSVRADVVVVGIGAAPATDWLEGSGLTIEDGLLCDAECRAVGAPFVVGVGDVARCWHSLYGAYTRVEHWTNAVDQSKIAAKALLGRPQTSKHSPVPYVWSDQYDRKIQVVGLSRGRGAVVEGSLEEGRFVAVYEDSGKLQGAVGVNSPRQVVRYRGLVGTDVASDVLGIEGSDPSRLRA